MYPLHGVNASLSQLSDEALVRLCLEREGKDERPFAELFRRYDAYLWNLSYRLMGNALDAEDLVQEVFFKVYRSLSQFQGRSAFKTWLYQIAVNTVRNEWRRRSRRPQVSDVPLEVLAPTLAAEETVEKMWTQHSRRELLEGAWASLGPAERQVLQLKDVEGRPYSEIARLLNASLSAVKMRVQRARLALRAAYQQAEGEA
jgi:RNA polymerase sigma-70 factor (ECF subfamily)